MTTAEMISIIAVAGTLTGTLIGTLGGSWLQSRLAMNREKAKDARDRLVALYIDAASYAQRCEAMLDWLVGEWEYRNKSPSLPDGIPHTELVTARINLLAPPSVRHAWSQLVYAADVLSANIRAGGDLDPAGEPTASADDRAVLATRKAVEQLSAVLQDAIRSESK